MMPAILATPKTSPFFMALARMSGSAVLFEKWRVQTAMAVREVMGLEEMGTMCAEPVGVRWVSFGSGIGSEVMAEGALEEVEEVEEKRREVEEGLVERR
jgi:hypothetical protein